MKIVNTLIVLAFALITPAVIAGNLPRGFLPFSELSKAQEKAKETKKLVAIVAKGSDDSCPRCAAAMENGMKAVRGDCVLVFTRVADLRKDAATLPAKLQEAAQGAADGAAVYFYVFDPPLETLVAKAGRDELESNQDAIRAFNRAVSAGRKAAKE